MEADWEFEVGGDAPIIDAYWRGFVDLRSAPELALKLPEAAQLPALAEALAKMNGVASRVWTSKCDFWPHLEAVEFDPDELDAPFGCHAEAMGCYIDLLPKDSQGWALPELVVVECKRICGLLRAIPLGCCRVDLVIRRAFIAANRAAPELMDLGITAYATSCGGSKADAAQTLGTALAAFADALRDHSTLE
ncbi:MAG: hypothetical protein ABSF70_14555 [Terracidiphilus sp.]|jgi:hypothetical protein